MFDDLGLHVLNGHEDVETFVIEDKRELIGSDQIELAQGVVVFSSRVGPETVRCPENLLAFSRVGVGYDTVDVNACTEADVALLITVGAVDRSVAEATVSWMLGLTHQIRIKDQLLRSGEWNERHRYSGKELRDRTFGAVGLGGIGKETIRLLEPFRMNKPIAYDPYMKESVAVELGVNLVALDELMTTADFVSIHCPLNEETFNLIGERELNLMKPDAYLINTARGGIANEDALYKALQTKSIAGAAIDCFVGEPITNPHRFGDLENVLLAPHAIAWTDELYRDIGAAACQGLMDLAFGHLPKGIVNREVLDRPGFISKWEKFRLND